GGVGGGEVADGVGFAVIAVGAGGGLLLTHGARLGGRGDRMGRPWRIQARGALHLLPWRAPNVVPRQDDGPPTKDKGRMGGGGGRAREHNGLPVRLPALAPRSCALRPPPSSSAADDSQCSHNHETTCSSSPPSCSCSAATSLTASISPRRTRPLTSRRTTR